MLVGQQIGPFLIEKELGAGAMGAVYRGKYLKTGQLVAIKVMSPTLGSSNPAALARFEREGNILRQLKHPNIVRFFGSGKHHGMPYYAMEYVQGESLDRIMARRDRMSWEQVVDLGKQLCSALQHSHDAGIVHRDLKPSNLMILRDGTVKLTDFGIAKDLDVTQLTGANCAIGTASYMSPEQCKGDPNVTSKSDLYSLGIVFYELITGRKPFVAENAMDLFVMHVKGPFERPSRLVPELPVWLDNLICQLMEKEPEKRPLNAAMVGEVLAGIQEKVEAQASAAVDAAKARRGDRAREGDVTQDDREAARALLGKKRRKPKPKDGEKQVPVWLQATGLLVLLAGVIGLVAFAMQPPSAQSLHDQAERMVKAGKLDEARDGPIAEYLRRYGGQETPQTANVRRWADEYDVAKFHTFMDRHVRYEKEKKGLAVEAKNADQKEAFKAAVAEHDGDRTTAEAIWKGLASSGGEVGAVARWHLSALEAVTKEEDRMLTYRDRARERKGEIDLDALSREAFLAWRQERLGDRAGALRRLESLQDEARKGGDRYWALYAAIRARQLREGLELKKQDDKARVETVNAAVKQTAAAVNQSGVSLLTLRATLHDVVQLYAREPDMAEPVEQARKAMQAIDQRLQ